MNTNEKELQKIDWRIVKQILTILFYTGAGKKTVLVMKTKLSYDKFILYLDWLELMDLIKKEIDNVGAETISLSENGRSFFSSKIRIDID